MSPCLFAVNYKWTLGGVTRYGRTVVTAASQSEAERALERLYPHITVVPVDSAAADVGKRNEMEAAA
jgi:hypothetical protein